jgi:hypothetical protein
MMNDYYYVQKNNLLSEHLPMFTVCKSLVLCQNWGVKTIPPFGFILIELYMYVVVLSPS